MAKHKYVERIPVIEPIVKVSEINPLFNKTDFPQTKVNNAENYEMETAIEINKVETPKFLHEDLERPEYKAIETKIPVIEEIIPEVEHIVKQSSKKLVVEKEKFIEK